MKIDLKDERELDEYILCHRCHTLHKTAPIHDGAKALCTSCGAVLYHRDNRMVEHGLALALTGLIFFVLANSFPLVNISILGSERYVTILSIVMTLVDGGYYLVGLFILYLIFLFPLMIFLLYAVIFTLLKLRRGRVLSGELMVLLAQIQPWHMSDIFLVSILVALVKLLGMASIHLGISFWTLIVFVIIDIYMTRTIHLGELWKLRDRIYGVSREESYAYGR
jgi:paraquat-inducible protein A